MTLSIAFCQTFTMLTWIFGANGKGIYGRILPHGHHRRLWTHGAGLGYGWLDVGNRGPGGYSLHVARQFFWKD